MIQEPSLVVGCTYQTTSSLSWYLCCENAQYYATAQVTIVLVGMNGELLTSLPAECDIFSTLVLSWPISIDAVACDG